MINKLANATADFIANSSKAQRFFERISNNASQVSVNASNSVNFIARPITIMATTKSKNILDGAYCASSSIASGIAETLSSKIVLQPFNKAVNKSTNQLQESGFFNSIAKQVGTTATNSQNMYRSALGRLALIALVPINSMIKFFIHPPLANKVKDIKQSIERKKLDVHI